MDSIYYIKYFSLASLNDLALTMSLEIKVYMIYTGTLRAGQTILSVFCVN